LADRATGADTFITSKIFNMSNEKKTEKPKRIHGVDVNRSTVKRAATLAEFKTANPHIFDHLGENESAAYAELWEEGYAAPAVAAAPATTAKAATTAAAQTS
jgi:hypothetical protein